MRESKLSAGSKIAGVQLVKLRVNRDNRGSFTEVLQRHWEPEFEFLQFSVVSSEANVMRGCHLHWNHDEYFCLLSGSASVGLRDERTSSKTRNSWSLYSLFGEDTAALIFPRGLVHGWYFHEPSMHLQAVTESYKDYGTNDNHRVHWQDPDLEIPWPAKEAIMTDLASGASTLKSLRKGSLQKA